MGLAAGVTTTSLLLGLQSGVIAGGTILAELAWLAATISSTLMASAMDGH